MEPKLRTSATFPSCILIDGARIDVRIKRLTNLEFVEFQENYTRWAEAPRGAASETSEAAAERNRGADAWMRDVLRRFVTLPAGQLEHDGRGVSDASELVDIFGGRFDVVPQLIALIFAENRLSAAEKKTFRSALDSQLGSTPHAASPTTRGDAPGPIVDAVAPKASVSHEAATADGVDTWSGTTVATS